MSDRRSASPVALLSHESRGALLVLALLGAGKAIALIGIATALARGIVSIIDGTGEWRSALVVGGISAVARALIVWATEVVAARAAAAEKATLRKQLAERVLARGGRDIREGQGELAILATRELDDLDDYFTQFLPAMVATVTVPLVLGARILFADWVSALIVALTVPLIPVFMVLIGTYTRDRVSEATDALSRLSNHLVELACGLPVLVGLGRAGDQAAALEEISDRHRVRTMATLRIAFLSSLALELIATISVAVVAVFIGVRLDHGTLPLETGLLVLILAPDCYLPFRQVGAAHHASQNGIEALRRVRLLIAQPQSRLIATKDDSGQIVIRDLVIHYPDRSFPAVDHLNLAAPRGAMISIEGPSGSGKSSVLDAISGLLGDTTERDGEHGMVVRGTITGIDRHRIARVSQSPATFAGTVLAEIGSGPDDECQQRAMHALGRLGIEALAQRHPSELSPGELRRVAFARACLQVEAGATTLLLDEPTAHLDRESAAVIRRAIADLRGTVTIIVASHDPEVQELADVRIPLVADSEVPGHNQIDLLPEREQGSAFELIRQTEPSPEAQELSVRQTLSQLNWLLNLKQPKMLMALLLGSLAALSAVALTALSGWLIVRASEQPPILMLTVAIVGVRFFGIGRAVFRYSERLATHDVIFQASTRLRGRVWSELAAQGPAVRRRLRGDAALDSLIGDVDRLRDLTPRVLFPPVIGLLTAIVATVALAIALPATLPLMVACLALTLVIAPAVARWADRRDSGAEVALKSRQSRLIAGLFGAAADLHVGGLDGQVLAEVTETDRESRAISRRISSARGLAGAIVVVSCVLASIGMVWICRTPIADGAISTELAAALILTPLALVDPLLATVGALQQLPALTATVSRFSWMTDRVKLSKPASTMDRARIDLVQLDQVAAKWPEQSSPIFRDLSVSLQRGDWLTVTGPSGAGKSTLLALLMGFLSPVEGVYRLNGVDSDAIPAGSIRHSVAWCPQEAFLFDSTLRANLLISRSRDSAPSDREMIHVLERVGLGRLLATLPNGLDTKIGAQGASLSGGERQRVAIARALLAGADLILLDEPTANLDRAIANQLMNDLREALRHTIVVMVTHNPDDIALSDLRVELSQSANMPAAVA